MKTSKNYLASAFFSRLMAAALLCLSLAACDTVDPYSDVDAADADLRTLETLTPEQLEAMSPAEVEALMVSASKKQANMQSIVPEDPKSPVEGAWAYMDEQDAATSHGNVAFTTTGQIRHLPFYTGTLSGSTDCKDFTGHFATYRVRTINLISIPRINITNSRCETLMEEDLIAGLREAIVFKMGEGNLYLGTYDRSTRERGEMVLQRAAAEENDGNDDTHSDSDEGSDDGGTYSDEGGNDDSDGGAYSDLPGNDDEESEEK